MHQLFGEAALDGRGFEVIFVFGKIFGHGGELAADVVPGIEQDFGRTIGGLDGLIFLHVLGARGYGKRGGEQGGSEKRRLHHLRVPPQVD